MLCQYVPQKFDSEPVSDYTGYFQRNHSHRFAEATNKNMTSVKDSISNWQLIFGQASVHLSSAYMM